MDKKLNPTSSVPRDFYVNAGPVNEFSDAVNVMVREILEGKPHAPRQYYIDFEKALKSGAIPHTTEYFNSSVGMGPLEAFKLRTPEIAIVYHVTVNDDKAKRIFEKGQGAKDVVNPFAINEAVYVFGKDFLHDEYTLTITKDGDRVSHALAQTETMNRMLALQRLQNAIERTPVAERTLINPNDPSVVDSLKQAYAVDGFVRGTVQKSFELQCLQRIGEEMANTLNVNTMSKFRDIMATFDVKFDAIGEDVPPAERVAMAVSDTAAAVAVSLPPKAANDLKAFCNSDAVRGIINETHAEFVAETESKEAGRLEEEKEEAAAAEEALLRQDDEHDEEDIDELSQWEPEV